MMDMHGFDALCVQEMCIWTYTDVVPCLYMLSMYTSTQLSCPIFYPFILYLCILPECI